MQFKIEYANNDAGNLLKARFKERFGDDYDDSLKASDTDAFDAHAVHALFFGNQEELDEDKMQELRGDINLDYAYVVTVTEFENNADEVLYEALVDAGKVDSLTLSEASIVADWSTEAYLDEEIGAYFLWFDQQNSGDVFDVMERSTSHRKFDVSLLQMSSSDVEGAFAEFAKDYAEECYEIPDYLANYIDWKAMGKDFKHDYSYVEYGGHIWIGRDC